MSVLSEQGPTNPQDPLHYAPRKLNERPEARLSTVSSAVGETHFDRLAKLDAARRPALSSLGPELENAVYESLRRQLNPEAVPEPPALAQERTPRRSFLIGAAAVGVAAVAALLFVTLTSRDNTGALFAAATSGLSQAHEDDAVKSALAQFRPLLVSSEGEHAFTHEQSEQLLEQFMQWRQKVAAGEQTR